MESGLTETTTVKNNRKPGGIREMTDFDAFGDTTDPERIGLQDVQAPPLNNLLKREAGVVMLTTRQTHPIDDLFDFRQPVNVFWNEKFFYPLQDDRDGGGVPSGWYNRHRTPCSSPA